MKLWVSPYSRHPALIRGALPTRGRVHDIMEGLNPRERLEKIRESFMSSESSKRKDAVRQITLLFQRDVMREGKGVNRKVDITFYNTLLDLIIDLEISDSSLNESIVNFFIVHHTSGKFQQFIPKMLQILDAKHIRKLISELSVNRHKRPHITHKS